MTEVPRVREAPSRLAVINGLRGLAILGVIYHHTLAAVWSPIAGGELQLGPYVLSPQTIFSGGWLGVNLFFILSGFVLGLPYALEKRSMATRADVLSYYGRRARRLLPLYYFCLLVAMFIAMPSDLTSESFLEDVLRMVTFGYVFQEATFLPRFNMALWSLGVEFWFSVLFPVVVVAFQRVGVWKTATVVLLLSFLVRLYAARTQILSPQQLHFMKDGLGGRLDDFVTGMVIAHLHARGRLPKRAASVTTFVLGVALLVLGAAGWDNVMHSRLPYAVCAALNNVLQLAFAFVLIGLLGDAPKGLRMLFTLRPLQLFGMLCYSLYLWHVMGAHSATFGLADVPIYLLLAVLFSAATYRYVEFPQKTWRELFLEYPA